jgi:hypothetical protein
MGVTFRILDPSTPPPGGWRYVQPESGRIFQHYARDAFLAEIRDETALCRLPDRPRLGGAEDQLCREHPEGVRRLAAAPSVGRGAPPDQPRRHAELSQRGCRCRTAGREIFVPQAEANRRP